MKGNFFLVIFLIELKTEKVTAPAAASYISSEWTTWSTCGACSGSSGTSTRTRTCKKATDQECIDAGFPVLESKQCTCAVDPGEILLFNMDRSGFWI